MHLDYGKLPGGRMFEMGLENYPIFGHANSAGGLLDRRNSMNRIPKARQPRVWGGIVRAGLGLECKGERWGGKWRR